MTLFLLGLPVFLSRGGVGVFQCPQELFWWRRYVLMSSSRWMQSIQRVRHDNTRLSWGGGRFGLCLLMKAIVPDWSLERCKTNRRDKPLYIINKTNHLALSPGQAFQPSLSGEQEGAKNLSVVYPSDTSMTT